jgi:hypothetical protein
LLEGQSFKDRPSNVGSPQGLVSSFAQRLQVLV